jgi:hypothetical protein
VKAKVKLKKKLPVRFAYVSVLFLISAAACAPQLPVTGGLAAATSVPPAVAPPNNPAPAAPAFQGVSPVDLPQKRADEGGDVNSSSNATSKVVSGGDVFVQGQFERPFNANTMDKYFPYLDIVDTQAFKDETWGYATITMANTDSNAHLPGQYAVELDLNKDGRGDWLIRASSVTSTQWSTQGVQAWKDTNVDVGGSMVMVADNSPSGGDGYETLVFDQGKGSLTDGAWARIKPDDPKTVEIAFKLSMVGNPDSYAQGAWAGTKIDPAMFDYNDHMTHAQAGSPLFGDLLYPIKDLAEIDNTCRLAVGFDPSTNTPGLCSTVLQGQSAREIVGGVAPQPPAPKPPAPKPPAPKPPKPPKPPPPPPPPFRGNGG